MECVIAASVAARCVRNLPGVGAAIYQIPNKAATKGIKDAFRRKADLQARHCLMLREW